MTTMLFSLATCRGEVPLPMFDGQDTPEAAIAPWPAADAPKPDFHRGPACAAFVMGRCRPDRARQREGAPMKPGACPLAKEAGICWHYLPKE
jgi:hypothetical protein